MGSTATDAGDGGGFAAPPAISLPKGGGAIRGIGEKFAANPVTGTASLTVPIATSPGRSGFDPRLSLSYDSGAGNGPFGFGWNLSLPAISRKTDKGLPRYRDGSESDVFLLSGAEDLVPELTEKGGHWHRWHLDRTLDDRSYRIHRYRPRVEGLFARIERWTDLATAETHWRSITRDNVTAVYGRTAESRVADPANPSRVFRWLICQSFDDTGNAISYEYKAEDSNGVDQTRAHERNRTDTERRANRYPKRISYGNRVPVWEERDLAEADWMFEVVFDYGEHDADNPGPAELVPWPVRADPFSSYRPGFELRTYRLCRRVLMFHHFPAEAGVGRDCLVRSTDLSYRDDPVASFVTAVTQRGYRQLSGGGYLSKALPPLELTYSEVVIDETPHTIDEHSLENLPAGLAAPAYQWADLDGEGLSGILTQQGTALFYKHNLGGGRFGPVRRATVQPSLLALGHGRQQLLDLAGDGTLDLVDIGGSTPGFYDRTPDAGWEPFRPFHALPTGSFTDPNLRLVDLNGDGHADILVTGDDVFTWHPSLAEEGFGPARRTYPAQDEERGPRLVFADPAQSIYLADMSGDGLADLVRVRNGEVCYWPNVGYGRFGAKVTMDGSPWFDPPDHFDQRRIRLADIDGSGTTDLIYLHRTGTRLYFNRAGNSLAPARTLRHAFPHVDDTAQVNVVDLLGTGTACLVWSSPLPSNTRQSMRYLDLMGGQKPHLLAELRNNLGADTRVHYAPSTKFYLADQAAGRPWITRLPFPVQVLEKIDTNDRIGRNQFTTRYVYHHGYFDGTEREFRGFGMVEQYDSETITTLDGTTDDPIEAANLDPATSVPPVLTRTWFHTGAFLDGQRISRHFAREYYPEGVTLPDTVLPRALRRPGRDPVPWQLSNDELRQAARALKGSMLRQEIYGLDSTEAAGRPYLVTEHNYTIEFLQPEIPPEHPEHPDTVDRVHAVFFTHPRETLTAHHERAFDPRIGHELVLAADDYGNVLRSVSVAYGRRDPDPSLAPADSTPPHRIHLVATENTYTNPVQRADAYRTPQSAETRTYELLGLLPEQPRFGFDELDRKVTAVADELPFQCWDTDPANLTAPARRLIEHVRIRYRRDDLAGPLPHGSLEPMALPYESYRLAFSPDLAADLYAGRVNGAAFTEAGYVRQDGDNGWWVPAGRVFYSPGSKDRAAAELEHARRHFFLPRRFRDPFGATTHLSYDRYDLLRQETRDPLGNLVTAANDYRVLAPRLVADANRNRAEAAFDALGMVAGTAVMGKPEEHRGDTLAGFDPDPGDTVIATHLRDPLADPDELLQGATTRLVYDLFAYLRTGQPPVVYTLARETHAADLAGDQHTKVQHVFSYSDGFGREIQKKMQAEPGPLDGDRNPVVHPRWVGSGWTIYNNTGKPVRQYEPFFTATHRFEFAAIAGVSSVLFYDPVERVIATLHPDSTYEKAVFDPWHQASWDGNDTVLLDPRSDPDVAGYLGRYLAARPGGRTWYAQRVSGELGATQRAAAEKTAAHAGTPTRVWFDSLGRTFLSVAHNRTNRVEEFYATRTHLDIEGNQREIVDARGRVVMRYAYDILAHRVHQASMEAGDRLLLPDVTSKPVYTWNSRGFRFRTEYDALRRPLRSFASGGDLGTEVLFERVEYGEEQPDALRLNLRTRPHRIYDAAGVVTHGTYDFKGNLLDSSRQLATEYRQVLDWSGPVPLEEQIYASRTTYDALNRPAQVISPDGSIIVPTYNEANLLERLQAQLRGAAEATSIIADLDYNARRQRVLCAHGNGARTSYSYDPLTFRLTRLRTVRGNERLQDLSYTYDPIGNITHIRDDAQQDVFFRNRRVEPSSSFTYDAIYRLIEASGREHLGQTGPVPPSIDDAPRVGLPHPGDGNAMGRYVQRYVYDQVGNILTMRHRGDEPGRPGWTRTYRYTEPSLLEPTQVSNRLTGTTDHGSTPPQPFAYDLHGNITSMPELQTMRWDLRDQLAATSRQVAKADTAPETTYYVYDAAGQRMRKVTDHQVGAGQSPAWRCQRTYLGGFEVFREYNTDGALRVERETLHIMDGKQRVALVETRTVGKDKGPDRLLRHQHANHLESACLELDEQAQIITYEEYFPFGSTSYQAVRSQAETPKRYRYTSKERDQENDLAYHGARYYVPWLGRWSAADPAGLEGGPNPFAYARNNPVRLVDTNGMDPTPPESLEDARRSLENKLRTSPTASTGTYLNWNLSARRPEDLLVEHYRWSFIGPLPPGAVRDHPPLLPPPGILGGGIAPTLPPPWALGFPPRPPAPSQPLARPGPIPDPQPLDYLLRLGRAAPRSITPWAVAGELLQLGPVKAALGRLTEPVLDLGWKRLLALAVPVAATFAVPIGIGLASSPDMQRLALGQLNNVAPLVSWLSSRLADAHHEGTRIGFDMRNLGPLPNAILRAGSLQFRTQAPPELQLPAGTPYREVDIMVDLTKVPVIGKILAGTWARSR